MAPLSALQLARHYAAGSAPPPLPPDITNPRSEWAERITRRQVPEPPIYPMSPWMPRMPDTAVHGRVIDPDEMRRTQELARDYPTEMTESGDFFALMPPPREAPPVSSSGGWETTVTPEQPSGWTTEVRPYADGGTPARPARGAGYAFENG
jgi:hypothetical protein